MLIVMVVGVERMATTSLSDDYDASSSDGLRIKRSHEEREGEKR